MITWKNVHFAKAPLIFKGRLKGRPSVSTWNGLTHASTQACKVGGFLATGMSSGRRGWGVGWGASSTCLWEGLQARRNSEAIMRNNNITRYTWWLPHYKRAPHWLLPQQDRTLLKDSLFSVWVFIISRRWGFWHLRQKKTLKWPAARLSGGGSR